MVCVASNASVSRNRGLNPHANLPPQQRLVVTFRDVQGWDSRDVCNVLDISETNQRVLLHRGRTRLRRILEEHLARS